MKAARLLKATWSRGTGCRSSRSSGSTCARPRWPRTTSRWTRAIRRPRWRAPRRRSSATYDFAVHTHGSMGPSCAVADVKDGKAEIWSPSQAPHWLRRELAATLADGREATSASSTSTAPAATAATATRTRPRRRAHLQADRPAGARAVDARRRARLGPEGPAHAGGDHGPGWTRRAASSAGTRSCGYRRPTSPSGRARSPRRWPASRRRKPSTRATSTATSIRRTPSRTRRRWRTGSRRRPFRPSWIRTPGRMQNTYANEVFIDECAAAAGADPGRVPAALPDRPARHRGAARGGPAWPGGTPRPVPRGAPRPARWRAGAASRT